MKFSRIYRESIKFWPAIIDVSDGVLTDNGGAYFPLLSAHWDVAEKASDCWSEWHKLMTWAIFNGLHKMATDSLETGVVAVDKAKISKVYVEQVFYKNLFPEYSQTCFQYYPKKIRRSYINDLSLYVPQILNN